jgi:hypothetical protein
MHTTREFKKGDIQKVIITCNYQSMRLPRLDLIDANEDVTSK